MLSESDLPAILDTFVPEEVWDKFQLDLDLTSALGNIESSLDMYYSDCLLHHDCMWTGLCDDKEHKFDEPRPSSSCNNNHHNVVEDVKPPVTVTTTSSTTKQQVFQPQQSLLKPRSVNPNTVLPMNNHQTTTTTTTATTPIRVDINNLQTPPMSDDDEETKPIISKTLTHVDDAIFESMLDDDLMKYIKGEDDVEFEGLLKSIKDEKPDDVEDELEDFDFMDDIAEESEEEDEEEEEEEEEEDDDDEDEEDDGRSINQNANINTNNIIQDDHTIQMRAYRAAASDHSYHKGTISLGIDTPSDSEEEIDVVSISKSTGALPTNPSPKDRHHLQRTMQSRFPQGIKTILPTTTTTTPAITTQSRRDISSTTPTSSPTKRKMNDNTTTNRGRNSKQYKKYHHHHQTQRQYRRRNGCGNSSDSDEPEPSEKRSLHNNMERQRRIDLRNLFEDLKALVPEVNKKQRAAKVLILRGAASYCRNLTNTSVDLNKKVDELKKRQESLRLRVSQLRRNLAANR